MTELTIEFPYKPRDYQRRFEEAMWSGKKRAMLVWHRRAGKDIACLNFMIHEMAKEPGVYYYLLPTFKQGRSVIWDGMDEAGRPILDYFPKHALIDKPNKTLMQVRMRSANGMHSLFQIIGTDNYNSIAGTNPRGVVFSEFSLQDPQAWELIISPILRKNKGWAVFNGTPRGKNHQYDLDVMSRNNPEWFYQRLTIKDTGLIAPEEIEKERAEGRSEELIQQEYYCSYDRGVEGSFYGKILDRMRIDGRICDVPYEPRSNVDTVWDIGFGDSTAIIWFQQVGNELRIIDHYEASGEALEHYVKVLQSKSYVYGNHYFPHDAGNHSMQTGFTLQRAAQDLGLKALILPRELSIEPGIEATRSMLSIAWIDERKCKHLLKCLENYHRRYNDKMGAYSNTPEHDWSSHSADATRYLAMSRLHYGKGVGTLTPERIKDMRMKHFGY